MLTSTEKWLEAELMDVVRLFPGAEDVGIGHTLNREGKNLCNTITFDGAEYSFTREIFPCGTEEEKRLLKRYSKLALYDVLSEKYAEKLPWGSLTGIRPTRLAYQEREQGRDFRPLLKELRVSEENIDLVSRILKAQEGIYERKEENVDLYVSLPFCPGKCSYCSFITAPIESTRRYLPAYLDALGRELSAAKPMLRNLRSVYVGGGTPFVLDEADLKRILEMIAPLRRNGCEYTVEAGRPDVFTPRKLDLCAEYGVTRICINAQSFSDRTLRAIGRRHTRAQLYEAFEMAKPYPFTVNCDLIAGLTGESLTEFRESVEQAIALSPENITVHTLCLKKGAKLKEEHLFDAERKKQVAPLSDENLSEMIAFSRDALQNAGYEPYYLYRQKYMAGAHENVGWTKRGFASVYNIDVMEESANNLAVGSNAITKRVFLQEGRIERIGSPKDIPTYIAKVEKLIEEKNQLFR